LEKYKSNNNIVYKCHYHVVWVTKYRKKYLTGDIEKRLKEICYNISKELKFDIIEVECDENHIHMLINVDPQFGVHTVIKRIKGLSSRLLRQEFPILKMRLPTLWTNSYFVSTVGGAPLDVIKKYIEEQKLR